MVLTSRGGGVLQHSLGGETGLPCQAGLLRHSRDTAAMVRDLPPEGMSWAFL
jgi:hypothetical protein